MDKISERVDSQDPGAGRVSLEAALLLDEESSRRQFRSVCIGLIFPSLLVLLWWVASILGVWSGFLLPSPTQVGVALWRSLASGEVFPDAAVSLSRVFMGVPLAVAIGLPLGLVFGRIKIARTIFSPTLEFLRNVPPIALIPLLILWLGIGEAPKIWVVALAALFPVLLNVEDAARRCDQGLIDMGRVFGLSRIRLLGRILLPWILPSLLVGIRLGFGYGWRALVGAELLGASAGLGYRIREAQTFARSDQVLSGILLLGLLGMASDALLRWTARRSVGRWSRIV